MAVALTALLPAFLAPAAAFAQSREVGLWYDDSGQGAVEIVPCGDKLCGRIAWLKNPLNDQGKPKRDRFNPNPERHSTPICGLQVIGGLQKMPEGTWDSGWIYDPKTGSAYDAAIQLVSPDQLKVTGYKGVKLFSKSFAWTRAPADLPRCETPPKDGQAAVPPATVPPAAKPAVAKKPAPAPQAEGAAEARPAATKKASPTAAEAAPAAKPSGTQKAAAPVQAAKKPAAKPNTATAGETLPWAKD